MSWTRKPLRFLKAERQTAILDLDLKCISRVCRLILFDADLADESLVLLFLSLPRLELPNTMDYYRGCNALKKLKTDHLSVFKKAVLLYT